MCATKSTRRNGKIKDDLKELEELCQKDDDGFKGSKYMVLQPANGVVPRFEYRAMKDNSYRHLGTRPETDRSGVLMTSLKNSTNMDN